ncbi:MAG: hypothetical protein HY302_03235 [Opitutae bacterium]|nr:hypothetical protein [Opitutae bacterium]
MKVRLLVWLALAAATLAEPLRAADANAWPFWVGRPDEPGAPKSWQAVGPLFFAKTAPDGRETSGLRPLFLQTKAEGRQARYFLYPFFSWQTEAGYSSFSFFQLVNDRRSAGTGGEPGTRSFDVWPFYFSRQTGDPATSYRALLPVAGTIKHRFGKDRLEWYAFPLFLRTEKAGMNTTYAPWPVLRVIDGAGHRGFEFWPLFGQRSKPGDYRRQFFLWPLFYKNVSHLSEPQPDVQVGALPFYTRESGPGYVSVNYAWPLFGSTHRTAPDQYDETRYLWPFLVQGRGATRLVNRWAPFYTHSVIKGADKKWFLWPLVRDERWEAEGLAHEKSQFFFFLYWSHTQRSLTNPAAAPASKTHLWPLLSAWDNGAGHRQVQVLSPLEIFFQNNTPVRELYTPLFALYRYDRRGPAETHWSLLWNAVSWHRAPARREFHLGPLLSVRRYGDTRRVAFGAGLLGWRRAAAGASWRFFLFDFSRPPAPTAAPAPSP